MPKTSHVQAEKNQFATKAIQANTVIRNASKCRTKNQKRAINALKELMRLDRLKQEIASATNNPNETLSAGKGSSTPILKCRTNIIRRFAVVYLSFYSCDFDSADEFVSWKEEIISRLVQVAQDLRNSITPQELKCYEPQGSPIVFGAGNCIFEVSVDVIVMSDVDILAKADHIISGLIRFFEGNKKHPGACEGWHD